METGMLLVISGPAGAGKGTLINLLREWDPSFVFSVSCTTRGKRNYEEEGREYYFLSEEEFDSHIRQHDFLEYATVHDHRYGTLRSEVETRLEQGLNVVLDIDVQGGIAVMQKMPSCVSVFIYPPSFQDLLDHLHTRGTEKEEEISKRMANAHREVGQMGEYQYLLLNDTLDTAFDRLKTIVQAERMRSSRFHPVIPEKRDTEN